MAGSESESFTSRSADHELVPHGPEEETGVRLALRCSREAAHEGNAQNRNAGNPLLLHNQCLDSVLLPHRWCTCVDTNHVEEIEELKAQVTSLTKDLEKSHEGMSTLNNVLCGQKSLNDKDGLGFNSNKKKKSKNLKKKGQEQVKNSAKIICFKCKIEGHHVRSCPLNKKPQSHKQQGKRPQVQSHTQLQVEERPLPKKTQANTPHVEKAIGNKLKGRCCYLCREKGHFASSCTRGTIGDVLDARLTYKEGVETM
ncbi:putative retrotransposon protein [Hordeum vulgare]|nr:putative retrotransposon protein [Hordeum vulgare]